MKNWMHTKEWQFEIAREIVLKDEPLAHVTVYYNNRMKKAGAIGAAKITNRPLPRQALNGIRNWYENGYVSPTEVRYPSFKEDPIAYILAVD